MRVMPAKAGIQHGCRHKLALDSRAAFGYASRVWNDKDKR